METLFAAIDALATKDPSATAKLKTAADHMPMTAAILAGAITKHQATSGTPGWGIGRALLVEKRRSGGCGRPSGPLGARAATALKATARGARRWRRLSP